MTRDTLRAAVQPHLKQDFDALYDEYVQEQGDTDPVGFLAHLAAYQLIPPDVARRISEQADAGGSAPTEDPPGGAGPDDVTFSDEAGALPGDWQGDDFDDEAHTVVADPEGPRPTPDRGAATTFGLLDAPVTDEAGPPAPPPPPAGVVKTATPFPAPRMPRELPRDESGPVKTAAPVSPPSDNRGPATAPTPLALGGAPVPPTGPDEDAFDDEPKTRRTMFRRMSDGGLREQTDVIETERRATRRRRRRNKPATPPVGEPGRYQFIGVVGEGAMGKIHLCEDVRLHRKVAFKAMSEEIAEHEQLASKFTAEARITAQLDHPNIVPVYNLETSTSYTMKLIKGITVDDIIRDTLVRLKNGEALHEVQTLQGRLELFLRACDALHYAHSRGVVHRDLKPENIMVGEFNELYVMDWGIARVMAGEFEDKVQTGQEEDEEGDLVIGTPGYMSPEQAEGLNAELDGASDQYSLGLILFELLTLRPAVTGKAPLKIVMRHQDGEKDPMVHALGEKIPAELRAIVHKATARDKAQRYESVKQLADDVRAYLRGDPTLARPDSPVQSVLRWMGRHRTATAFAVFLTIGMFGFIAFSAIALTQIQLANARTAEQLRSNLLATAAAQSSLIDGQFLKYEGLLSVIATHAEDSLRRPALGQGDLYTANQFDEGEGPPDLVDSRRYGRKVSLGHSAYVLAPSVQWSSVRGTMAQLQSLDRHYYKILLRSHSEGAATYTPKRAQRALVDVGVPIARAYVGLESGLHQAYPGHGGWPARYDPRTTAWYELARTRRGPNWGAPAVDLHGQGLVLTCAQALYDADDNFLGVAGVDVTFDYIIEDLLELPGFDEAPDAQAYLLDRDGRVVVQSSDKGANRRTGDTLDLEPFDNEDVLQAVAEKRTGYTRSGTDIVVYNRMNSIGWYYVVAGPEDQLTALADR